MIITQTRGRNKKGRLSPAQDAPPVRSLLYLLYSETKNDSSKCRSASGRKEGEGERRLGKVYYVGRAKAPDLVA
jgi:hypothetical protein